MEWVKHGFGNGSSRVADAITNPYKGVFLDVEERSIADLLAGQRTPDALQRVIVAVHHALFELDDGIVRDLNAGRANFGAASGDVAVFDAEFLLDFRNTVFDVKRMHFVLSQSNEVPRSGEIIEQLVVPQDVTGVDTQETLDALTEVLDTVGFHLIELPIHGFGAVDGGNALGNIVVPAHIGHQVLDVRERLHRADFDGLAGRGFSDHVAHPRHAHQAGATVDLSRT